MKKDKSTPKLKGLFLGRKILTCVRNRGHSAITSAARSQSYISYHLGYKFRPIRPLTQAKERLSQDKVKGE